MESKQDILLDHIDSRLDVLNTKVQQETKQLKSMCTFFQTTKKELEKFTKSYQKALHTLKTSLGPSNGCTGPLHLAFSQHEEVVKAFNEYGNSLASDIIDPLDLFAAKYEVYNKNVLKEGGKIIETIADQRGKIRKAKERYFKDTKSAMDCNTEEAYRNKIRIAEESKEEYKELVMSLNQYIDANKDPYKKLLQTWHTNEERKMEYVKKEISKFCDLSQTLTNACTSSITASKKITESIVTSIEARKYISIPPARQKLFEKAIFEAPSTDRASTDTKGNLARVVPLGVVDEDLKFVENKVKNLLEDEPIPEAEKVKLLNLARTSEGVKAICVQFALLSRKVEIENLEVFNILSDLALIVLDQLANQKFPETPCFASMLTFGGLVAHTKSDNIGQKYKKYVRDKLSDHSVWRSKDIWDRIIDFKIGKSVAHLHAYMLMKQGKSPYEKEKEVGFMKKILNAGATLIRKKPKDPAALKQEEQEEAGKRGIAFSELASTALEMALYSIDKGTCRDLIIEFSKEYGIETDKVYQLLSDYECAQPLPRDDDPRPREKLRCSLDKREKERKRHGPSKSTMILGMSLKFLADPKALASILLVNKEWYNMFKAKVYKIALYTNAGKIRYSLWKTILFSKGLDSLYAKLKEKNLEDFIANNKTVEEVIRLDVIRSFHVHPEATQLSIMNILRCYAVLNPEVEYCQGMNCIAGLLFLIYKDEPTAFTMMSTLIANFGLSNLFKQDVPLLRMYFYQMNRLLAVFLPKLHAHLFEEGINATYFCSPWFLTAFTYILQFSKSATIPPLLLSIFDGFLANGIKSLFKSSLFILEHFEEKLLGSKYESIVQFLSELPRTDFFTNVEIETKYKERIKRYNITQELLNRLNEEHKQICIMSQECKNLPQPPRQPFKHYVCLDDDKLASVYFPNQQSLLLPFYIHVFYTFALNVVLNNEIKQVQIQHNKEKWKKEIRQIRAFQRQKNRQHSSTFPRQ
eukprot:TRINITY_DN3590_c0_g1_i2.p1 TRINITY_DN3590_c0_g1~~TRINITY_DN3590_c0_g1_i2.p1  ORF type:complete len:978 (+),score=127.42 TRINITY_DN3590_c0_g1_i2:1000-3933(+)